MASHNISRVWGFCFIFAAVLVWGGTARFQVRFDREDLVLTETRMPPDNIKMTSVRMAQAIDSASPGFPRLPCVVRQVAVPAGAEVGELNIILGEVETYRDHPLIEWRRGFNAGDEGDHVVRPPEFEYDEEGNILFRPITGKQYPMDPSVTRIEIWPPVNGYVRNAYRQGGYDVLRIVLYPVRWMPQTGVLQFARTMTVGVPYSGGSTPPQGRQKYVAHAETADLISSASNAGDIAQAPDFPLIEQHDAPYVIITDSIKWSSDMTPGAAVSGNMKHFFQFLADWKTQKGIKAKVVTISEIMDHEYGVFDPPGTRDLQEVIRNFLKHIRVHWNTYWVLLGGDTSIIPARHVAGNIPGKDHTFVPTTNPVPELGECHYDSGGMTVRIHQNVLSPSGTICSARTGRPYTRVQAPSMQSPGWAYMTDDNYDTESTTETAYVLLAGQPADLEDTVFYIVTYDNLIPTDLYYASVASPLYGQPGRHDWDQNDNGIYGQYYVKKIAGNTYDVVSIDGVDFEPDLMVGRASVENGSQAWNFIQKVLNYEQADANTVMAYNRLLLGATDWYKSLGVKPGNALPPDPGKYFHEFQKNVVQCHLKEIPSMHLFTHLVAYRGLEDYTLLPYDPTQTPSSPGYYYSTDDTYSDLSTQEISYLNFTLTLPDATPYVCVWGPVALLDPGLFFFDNPALDPSAAEKEMVKDIFVDRAPMMFPRVCLYEDHGDLPPPLDPDVHAITSDAIVAEIESGYNIVTLSGHGSEEGVAGINRTAVQALTNGHGTGIVYVDGCLTGAFDYVEGHCLGEEFLVNPDGGSAAYIGNSRFSWIGSGAEIERCIWEGLSWNVRIGLLHRRKAACLQHGAHAWAQYSLNLLGDPEMSLWIDQPIDMAVDHENVMEPPFPIEVYVRGPDGGPVERAVVCITGPDGVFMADYTNSEGICTLSTVDLPVARDLVITVTCGQHTPYQGTISLLGSGDIQFVRGDCNADGAIDLSDAIMILNYLFFEELEVVPSCLKAADANASGVVDLADVIYLLSYLFRDGDAPAFPFGECGRDDDSPRLTCNAFPLCE